MLCVYVEEDWVVHVDLWFHIHWLGCQLYWTLWTTSLQRKYCVSSDRLLVFDISSPGQQKEGRVQSDSAITITTPTRPTTYYHGLRSQVHGGQHQWQCRHQRGHGRGPEADPGQQERRRSGLCIKAICLLTFIFLLDLDPDTAWPRGDGHQQRGHPA